MDFKRALLLCLGLLALVVGSAADLQAATKKKGTKESDAGALPLYKGAIVMDAATGAVLFEDHADTISPPASMTKLMTFAVVLDSIEKGNLKLDTPITVNAADAGIGGTQVWLKEGEVFPVEELLYAMMIQSANDAAHSLARVCAGSVDAFVQRMNEKAGELGMKNTTFKSPHGLPPRSRSLAESDLTSARDFALLSRHLLTHTNILKYTIRQRPFGAPNRLKLVDMINHNHLLGKVDGVDGLKTGYTAQALHCLAASAKRDTRRVIVVLMGGRSSLDRDHKVIELLETGFSLIPAGSSAFVDYQEQAISPAANSPFLAAPLPPGGPSPVVPATQPKQEEEAPMVKFQLPPAPKRSSK